MRQARTIIAVALLAAAVAGGRPLAPPGPSANPPGMKRLSDERTLSRWAYPNNHARVRSRPTAQARTVAKLHWLTEDNLPEIYLVLASWRDGHKNTWVKIRVPKRPNGVTGWVPRRALRQYTAVQHLPGPQPLEPAPHALPRRARPVMSAHVGHRLGREPDAARALLRAREVPRQGRAGLRALRAGHQRIRAAPDRLAGRRRRRPARHQRAGPRSPAARRTAASACATRRSRACTGSPRAGRRCTSTTEVRSAASRLRRCAALTASPRGGSQRRSGRSRAARDGRLAELRRFGVRFPGDKPTQFARSLAIARPNVGGCSLPSMMQLCAARRRRRQRQTKSRYNPAGCRAT